MDFLNELWRFMRVRKKFWLLPILIMMVVFGGLVVLTKGSASSMQDPAHAARSNIHAGSSCHRAPSALFNVQRK